MGSGSHRAAGRVQSLLVGADRELSATVCLLGCRLAVLFLSFAHSECEARKEGR